MSSAAPQLSSGAFLERYIDYPPLYTLQPNLDVRARQLSIWKDILKNQAPFYLDPESPILSNLKIGRKMTFFEVLKSHLFGAGLAMTLPDNRVLVLPAGMQELASEVLRWARDSSHLNVVETFAYLQEKSEGYKFRGLPDDALLEIFRLLQSRGQAKLVGTTGFKIPS